MDLLLLQLQDMPPYVLDIIRLGFRLLLLSVIFLPLEIIFSLHKQKIFRKAFWLDLGYYFVNGLLLLPLLALPSAAIAWGMHRLVPEAVVAFTGSLPLIPRLLAALVVGEFGFYWGHRWTHEVPLFWRFHKIHHSAEEMDWLVNVRAHPLDMVFVRLCGMVPLFAVGLATPAAGGHLDKVTLFVLLVGATWSYFIHANLRWRFGWLSYLISTPAFHHWHHTNDEHVDKNYASMLPIWDILFGSWYLPKNVWPSKYGIEGPLPSDLLNQTLHPFLPDKGEPESTSAE